MAHFRFRLQKLLEYRQRLVDEARIALAKADQALAAANCELEAARAHRAQLDQAYREPSQATVTALSHARALGEVRAASAREARASAALLRAEQARQAARAHVERCHRGAKMLERLRERRLQSHREEERAQERHAMDDVAGRRGRSRPLPPASPARRRG